MSDKQWDEARAAIVKELDQLDADIVALTKARLEASVIIAALQHAADRGVVSFNVAENTVEFMWPLSDQGLKDALLVFEAFTGRLDKGKGQ